jgi:hypothetical protein
VNAYLNPWSRPINREHAAMVCDAACRLDMVRSSTDVQWLESVIAYPRTQQNVRYAAKVKLRKLGNDQAYRPGAKTNDEQNAN